MFLCQHIEGCLKPIEANTEMCASHNREERKRIKDEEKEKHKRSKQQRLSEERNRKAKEHSRAARNTPGVRIGENGSNEKAKRIKPRSTRRAAEERRYNIRVKEWKLQPENEICKVCNEAPTDDCHHQKGREGKRLLDERYWLPVCRSCHIYLTEDSAFAIREGYSLPRNN